MEIITTGIGEESYKPDQIILTLTFVFKDNLYDEVLENGTKSVLDFVNNILYKYGFSENDIKTKSFIIKEEQKYNEETRSYDFDGYSYNQTVILKFDYELEKLTNMMKDISKLSNHPYYKIEFSLKDEEKVKKELISKAYNDAKEKANIIALASNKILKDCIKVSFKPLDVDFLSLTSLDNSAMYLKEASMPLMNKIFTPEDITLSENIYCLWISE